MFRGSCAAHGTPWINQPYEVRKCYRCPMMATLRYFTPFSPSFYSPNSILRSRKSLFSYCKAVSSLHGILYAHKRRCFSSEVELTSVRYHVQRGNYSKVNIATIDAHVATACSYCISVIDINITLIISYSQSLQRKVKCLLLQKYMLVIFWACMPTYRLTIPQNTKFENGVASHPYIEFAPYKVNID